MRGWLAALALAVCGWAAPASAQGLDLPSDSGAGDPVHDYAELLDAGTEARILAMCSALLAERGVELQVVTIRSMARYGAGELTIEGFARRWFDHWGVGNRAENAGILLLVSTGNRKARIELGAGWGGGKHRRSQEIMDSLIIPRFKAGDFPGGVETGVAGLDAMARDKALPRRYRRPVSGATILMWLAFIGLAVFTGVSLYRRGASGYAWLFWGGVFTLLFLILRGLAESRSRGGWGGGGGFGGGGGGFGGGGGGFSGGGGATGSW